MYRSASSLNTRSLPHDLGGLTDCISIVLSVVKMLTHMTTSLPVGSLYAYNYHFSARRYISTFTVVRLVKYKSKE